ncbi:MAG: lipase family protein [Aphanothece sp. CMT-3BRIN-NPC111]|jgi:pimeloyl-ACP methyl ester carboxylesterase|nr:lipase family protein [Aphanothece sp. CMT-3BRIN-NPC111]
MSFLPDPNQSTDRVIVSRLDTYPEGFDFSMARRLAGLTQQAYEQFNLFQLKEKLCKFKLEKPYQLDTELAEKDVPFGFVASEAGSDNVYVIFRGTKRIVEWFKDANVQLVSYKNSRDKNDKVVEINEEIVKDFVQRNQSLIIIPNIDDSFGFVTAGFRGIYVSLREKLIDVLKQKPPNSKIFVPGHSLGGAIATLAIPDILKNTHFINPKDVVLYTFASPRSGDRHFAANFQKLGVQHWRIANTEDFITMLPFPTGNVVKPAPIEAPPEEKVTEGAAKGNPFFQFLEGFYNSRKHRMADYAHTGTPIYFTIHEGALERHHNLDEVYMLGISQDRLTMAANAVSETVDKIKDKVTGE